MTLPPLPEPSAWLRHEDACGDEVGPPDAIYNAYQMREYARMAVEADRAARGKQIELMEAQRQMLTAPDVAFIPDR